MAVAMLMRWIRFRGMFRLYLYVLFICFCMTVLVLSTLFSGMEVYHVRLSEEIKDEVDLSMDQDESHSHNKLPTATPKRTTSRRFPRVSPLNTSNTGNVKGNYHVEGLHAERLHNELLMKTRHGSRTSSVNESVAGHSPCIGKPAPQEFIFHKVARDIFIFSAFWDARWNDFDNVPGRTWIRMMGITSAENRDPPLSCLFYIRGAYHIIPAFDYGMSESHNKKNRGFIYSCEVPVEVRSRVCSVLVSYGETADPKWAIRVPVTDTQPREDRRSFSQCVPPLFGDLKNDRLIEFIEMSRLLGSEHVTFYNMNAPEKLNEVLEYYKLKGVATVIPWPLPKTFNGANLWYNGQMIAIQDCLYRNMALTDFLIFNDLDEHIVPRTHRTWPELVGAIDRNDEYIAYVFKSSFFDPSRNPVSLTDVEQYGYLTVVRDVMRTAMISRLRDKCIVKPREIFEKGIHHISKPISAASKYFKVNSELGLLHHYRQCLATYGQDCERFVQDTMAWKFAAQLHERVQFAKNWIEKLTS